MPLADNGPAERSGKACGHKLGMYAIEKSDIGVLPKKEPNDVEVHKTAGALGEKAGDLEKSSAWRSMEILWR